MKTEEQILNEFARLAPVKCFNGHEEEWNPFVKCCESLRKHYFNIWGLREILIKSIIGECDGRCLLLIEGVTKNLGSCLIDEAVELFRSLNEKIFDPKYLLRFENKDEFFYLCFPSSKLPKISDTLISYIKDINQKNKKTPLHELGNPETNYHLSHYVRQLTGMESAIFEFYEPDKSLVKAVYPTTTVLLRFNNAYSYEVIRS